MLKISLAAAALLMATAPAAAFAADAPVALPAVDDTLEAGGTTARKCSTVSAHARRGVAATTYRAPIAGFASFRLGGSHGDWDLSVVDAASGRRVGSSQGFGAREVVQGWVTAGQRLIVLGCHRSGPQATRMPLRIELVAAKLPASAAPTTTSLVRVQGKPGQIQVLEDLGLDVTHEQRESFADVLVSGPAQLDLLRRTGLPFATRIADMSAFAAKSNRADARYGARVGRSPLPSGRTTYREYDDYQNELKALVDRYPDRVKPVVIGHSYQGRELMGVEIADHVKADDGRPTYMVVALHHAREWPSAEAAMEFATMLARADAGDARVADMLARVRTVVVPLVNPDGFVSTRAAEPYDPADQARPFVGEPQFAGGIPPSTVEAIAPPGGIFSYRRKNCAGAIDNPDVPCELQWGVDPNRNYGELWGGTGGSPDPTTQTYHGPGPWSEPETQAVHRFSQERPVTMIITLHNVAALVLRPPGLHDNGLAPDEPRLKQIGDAMAAATGYTSQYSFQLYDTAGTTEDWNYAAQGAYGYTIEIGPAGGSFHMPYETGFVKEWTGSGDRAGRGLRDALLIAGEAAANPADHSIIAGRAPAGRTLRLEKTFVTRTSRFCKIGFQPALQFSSPPLSTVTAPKCAGAEQEPMEIPDKLETTTVVPASGSFEWHVDPSTRPFVGADKVTTTISGTPVREATFTGKGDETYPSQLPVGNSAGKPDHVDYPFTVAAADGAKRLHVTLDWPTTPEDYDLDVLRIENGAQVPVGSSGNPNGVPEEVTVKDPPPGDYIVRVKNYLGPTSTWTARVQQFAGVEQRTPGTKEAWTLTCEKKGRVVESRQVIVDRGQRVALDLPCGGRLRPKRKPR